MKNDLAIKDGLSHIERYASKEEVQSCIDAIHEIACSTDDRSPNGAYLVLSECFSALSLKSLIKEKNVVEAKKYANMSSHTMRLVVQLKPYEQAYSQGFDLLYPLLSDNSDLIHWHSQYQLSNFILDRKSPRVLNPEKYEYHSAQPRIAMQKDWETLVERSEFILKNPPKKNKYYIVDHQFYLALAKGDTVLMEQAIYELVSPKIARHRNKELQWGIERRLINGWGLILAKLAYHLGYELDIDSPWIPQEWLPVQPLENYNLPYDFLSDFDLFTPFEPKDGVWCGDVARFSPRPLCQAPLSFNEIKEMLGAYP